MRLSCAVRPASLVLVFLLGLAPSARGDALFHDPASVTFPDTPVEQPSVGQSVQWSNGSGQVQTVQSLAIVGANAGEFQLTDDNLYPDRLPDTTALDPVTVVFAPVGPSGPRSASLRATLADGTVLDCPLSGNALGAQLQIAPSPIDLGGGLVGVPRTVDVTVQNGGGGFVVLTAVTLAGADAGELSIVNPPGVPLTLGPLGLGAVAFQVRFTPGRAGAHFASLHAVADIGALDAPIVGRAGDPAISSDTGAVLFPATRVDFASPPTPITLTNSGNSDLVVNSVAVMGGPDPGDFGVDLGGKVLPVTLAVGQSLVAQAWFAPTAAGPRGARLQVQSSDPLSPVLAVSLSGNGARSRLTVGPDRLAFGNQAVNLVGLPLAITITNSGDADANLVGIAFGANSWFQAGGLTPLPLLVPAMGSVTVPVFSLPLAVGPGADTVTLTTDDALTPTLPVGLTVTGVAASVAAAPAQVDFGEVAIFDSATRDVVISNRGDFPLTISAAGLAPPFNRAFDLTLPAELSKLPSDLAPGQSVTLTLRCSANALGPILGELDLELSGDPSTHALHIPMVCQGVLSSLLVSPGKLDFGVQLVNFAPPPQTVIIKNNGTVGFAIASIADLGQNPDQFQVAPDPRSIGPLTLAPGESRQLVVTYQPTMPGQHAATLVVTPADPKLAPAQVKLTGAANAPMLCMGGDNPGLTFPKTPVGATDPTPLAYVICVPQNSAVPVTITDVVSSSPEFIVDASKLQRQLAGGQRTSVDVYFRPSQAGQRVGQISVSVKGVSTPLLESPLRGEGFVPVVLQPALTSAGCAVSPRPSAPSTPTVLLAVAALLLLGRRRPAGR